MAMGRCPFRHRLLAVPSESAVDAAQHPEVVPTRDRSIQTGPLAAMPLWAALAEEEWWIEPRTEAQRWRRQALEEVIENDRIAEQEERSRMWREQAQLRQDVARSLRSERSRTPRPQGSASSWQ